MRVREVTSPRKHGPDVTYLQLVDAPRDPKTGKFKTRILHSFGRVDQLDVEKIKRLVDRLSRYLDEDDRPELPRGVDVEASWDFGGPYLLDALWRELKLNRFFAKALRERSFEHPVERALFTMVAQRALAPDSKRAASRWAGRRAWIPGLERGGGELELQYFYRGMDFLYEAMPELAEHLYSQVTDLLNADVSILFYDTTTVSFYLDEADDEDEGLRRYGHSKKKRPDLPQVVVALAINRDGLPVRHWIFPGNRQDVTTVEEVTRDLGGLRPRQFVFVGDRGLVSQANLDYLESRRLPYLLGCPLRDDETVQEQVLTLRGRYRPVAEGLGVKETTVTEGARTVRYLLCRDEERAARDAEVRRAIVERLEAELSGSKSGEKHTRKSCKLLSQPGYARLLRELKGGGLKIDRGAIRREQRLDGKWVLMTNDLDRPAEELVLGFRRMWLAERAFRSMKSVLEIEPVHHRTPERITAHVHLCVLALLLCRVVEGRTQTSWELVREELEPVSLVELVGNQATARKTKRLTPSEREIFEKCGVTVPPRVQSIS